MTDDAAELPTPFVLALPFDTDEREFIRGFQLGMLWGRIDPAPTVLVYGDCAEMLARIRVAHPDAFDVTDNGGDWLAVHFPALDTD